MTRVPVSLLIVEYTCIFSVEERQSAALFCVMSNIVQRMRLDSEVEIYHNIRQAAYLMQDITEVYRTWLKLHVFLQPIIVLKYTLNVRTIQLRLRWLQT